MNPGFREYKPLEMEKESIAEVVVEGDGEQREISKLPLEMKKLIFAKLSIQSISGSRMVSNEWNSILSSQSFLSSLPAENPWLLIYGEEEIENWQCMAYCFSDQKWRTISLSFLPNPEGRDIRRRLSTTAQGLLLFRDMTPFRDISTREQLYVCNPLTRSYAEVEIDVTDRLIHLVKGTSGDPYLVVCSNYGKFSFQIYHYFQDSWRIKYEFAGDTGYIISGHEVVECNGVLFWKGMLPRTLMYGSIIVGYNIQDGFINPVTIAPLSLDLVVYMFAYGSSVLVVEAFFDRSQSSRACIIIRELFQDEEDKLLWKLKEIARMPPSNLPEFLDTRDCVCVGDYLCFSSLNGRESVNVFAYNLKEGFWQSLPPCKIYYCVQKMMLSFEPKLNLYQFFRKSRE